MMEQPEKNNELEEGELNPEEKAVDSEEEKNAEAEDVPDEFFEDFDAAFMDGLDIVDAWDSHEKNNDKSVSDEVEEKKDVNDEVASKDESPKLAKKLKLGKHAKFDKKSKRYVSKEYVKKLEDRRKAKKAKLADNFDLEGEKPTKEKESRRDPDRTKRDIEKDKEKSAKSHEQKIIKEKLKVVETGLVPPGTEMDINLSEIKEKTNGTLGKEKPSKRDEPKSDRVATKKRSLSRSLEHIRRFPDNLRGRRSRSPYRSRSRSPYRRPVDHFSRLRRHISPLRSPPRRRPRPFDGDYRKARSRSRSPEKKQPRSTKSKEKMSFLEELQIKLGEVPMVRYDVPPQPIYNNPYVVPIPNPVPMPAPVPAPVVPMYPPPDHMQYDQQFFIGDAPIPQMNVVPQLEPHVLPMEVPLHAVPPPLIERSMHMPPLIPLEPFNTNVNIAPPMNDPTTYFQAGPTFGQEAAMEKDINKLFADKKLSLSEFLSITAKPEVQNSSPAQLQKKIKVLSRCQDALKLLGSEKKYAGHLSVKITNTSLALQGNNANASPLLKNGPIRLHYTTPPKNESNKENYFASEVNKFLTQLGIVSDVIDLIESDADAVEEPAPNANLPKRPADRRNAWKTSTTLPKMVQTEPIKCESCDQRQSIRYCSQGVQSGNSLVTMFSVGTQVTEEDISPRGIFKNQSLAYLTPAQLLGKGAESAARPSAKSMERMWLENERFPGDPSRPMGSILGNPPRPTMDTRGNPRFPYNSSYNPPILMQRPLNYSPPPMSSGQDGPFSRLGPPTMESRMEPRFGDIASRFNPYRH